MRFAVYQVSRKGGREKNEDRMGYCYTRDAGLFALADGMGGHPDGEVAAQLALQTLASRFQREARTALDNPLQFLEESVLAAHYQLLRYAQEHQLVDTPRTTVVACVLQGHAAYWAHCGDSRLYLVRDGRLIARTRDHSYSELQETLSRLMPVAGQFNRNVLFTCLGTAGRPLIDTSGPMLLQPGDRLLLCSDGLWGAVPDEAIVDELASRPVMQSVPVLVERALREAGAVADNTTAVAVEWESAEQQHMPGEDLFASTIQASPADGAAVAELDEEEIERSIREINETIRRRNR